MSYFTRLAEQAGVTVADADSPDTFVAAAVAPDSAAPASLPDAAPDMLEIDELVEVAAPLPAATAPPAPRLDPKPLSSPGRKAANVAEFSPPVAAAPQPQAVAFDNDPLASPPVTAATLAGPRPAPDPVQAEPSLLRQALQWVASDPASAFEPTRVPSPEGAKPDVRHAAARPAEAAAQAPRTAPKQDDPVVRAAPSRLPIPEAEVERMPPQAAAMIPAAPAASIPAPADTPATRAARAPMESQVEEVVQVSIGNIHVRVETPAPSAMPEAIPAAPRAAPAHPPQAPATRLRRRYLHL